MSAPRPEEGTGRGRARRLVTVVACGPHDPLLMTGRAREALRDCDLVLGAARVLAALPDDACRLRVEAALPGLVVREVDAHPQARRVCVAVSGDVGLHSGARGVVEALSGRSDLDVRCEPGVGSVQMLAARLGRPWQDWRVASAHGAPCDAAALLAGCRDLFLLTDPRNTPDAICRDFLARGAADGVLVSVGERLSYPDERVRTMGVEKAAQTRFSQPCCMLLSRTAPPVWPFSSTGIPDEEFERARVPMTKQEVRAVALSKLRVGAGDTVWDVGSGTGSVTVEAALLAREGRVAAVERDQDAYRLTCTNVARFGLSNVRVVLGDAPDALEGLPAPDAVFVGGSAGRLAGVLDAALSANPRVRLCLTCVTVETFAQAVGLLSGARWRDVEFCQVSVSRSYRAGDHHLMRAQSPVTVVSARGSGAERGE